MLVASKIKMTHARPEHDGSLKYHPLVQEGMHVNNSIERLYMRLMMRRDNLQRSYPNTDYPRDR
jgi:hypothetical protein